MTWDEIYSHMAETADKVAIKIRHTTDRAALEIKRTAQEKRLQELYATLGKLFYRSLSAEQKEHDNDIAATIEQIKLAEAELEATHTEIRKNKESDAPSA